MFVIQARSGKIHMIDPRGISFPFKVQNMAQTYSLCTTLTFIHTKMQIKVKENGIKFSKSTNLLKTWTKSENSFVCYSNVLYM